MLGNSTYSQLPFSTLVNVAEILEANASFSVQGTMTIDDVVIGRLASASILGTANVDVLTNVNRIPKAIDMMGEARMYLTPTVVQTFIFYFNGTAKMEVNGKIAGEGWERVNPNTPEWQYNKSSKWNKIN